MRYTLSNLHRLVNTEDNLPKIFRKFSLEVVIYRLNISSIVITTNQNAFCHILAHI